MTPLTANLAESLGISESELMQEALRRYVREKRREILQERLEILARYQVDSLQQLESQIASGETAEHPAWEDLITIETLEARLEELDGYLHAL